MDKDKFQSVLKARLVFFTYGILSALVIFFTKHGDSICAFTMLGGVIIVNLYVAWTDGKSVFPKEQDSKKALSLIAVISVVLSLPFFFVLYYVMDIS